MAGTDVKPSQTPDWEALRNAQRARLRTVNETALVGGGKDRVEKQHKAGKLTARELSLIHI